MSKVIEEAFRAYDKNGDGQISAEELVLTMKALECNVSLAGAQNMIQQYDLDDSGTLELDEFKKMIWEKRRHKQIFDKLDADESGSITKCELMEHVRKMRMDLSQQDVEDMFNDIDVNGDGKIDLKEFSTFLNFLKRQEDAEQQQEQQQQKQ